MHNAKTIWLTGLSGSGKTTLANALQLEFQQFNIQNFILDGDIIRLGLNKDLGFSEHDRAENLRRVAEVAKILNSAGITVIAAFISPLEKDRKIVKNIIGVTNFFEVYVNTSLTICEQRDPKGLYKKARTGQIQQFTGISALYEQPINPNIVIDTDKISVDAATAHLFKQFQIFSNRQS
jgi:adenylylsulfate kinase